MVFLPNLLSAKEIFLLFLSEKTSRGASVLTLIQCSLKARVVRSESDGSFTLTLSVPELERAFGKKFKSKTKYKKKRKKEVFTHCSISALSLYSCKRYLVLFQTTGKFRCHLSLFHWLFRPFILVFQASFLSQAADELHLCFFIQETSVHLFFPSRYLACLTFTHRRNEGAPGSFCPTSSSSFILRVCFFFLSVLPTLFHFPFFDERQHSGLVSVDANDYDDDFYTFF